MIRNRWLVTALALVACRTVVVQEGAIITPVQDPRRRGGREMNPRAPSGG